MIFLKAIHTSFTPEKHAFFHIRKLPKRSTSSISLISKSKGSNSDSDSDSAKKTPEGDTRKQELLARIAMLQAQKVRLTDYLDERSAYLTQFAEEANAEFDQVGENALRELDEASARIMENIESRMQEFEESSQSSKMEMEKNQKKVDEFEVRFENDRNEGLFFRNLGQTAPADKTKAKEETDKIREVTNETAGTKTRRNIYLVLIGLVTIAIIDSFVYSLSDWRRVAILGVVLVGLITQVTYEQSVQSEKERLQAEEREDNE